VGNIPLFKTEEQEAEFWDTHNPLDFGEHNDVKPLIARKDRSLTIKLDGRTYQRLKDIARNSGVGVSTVVRLILMSFLRQR